MQDGALTVHFDGMPGIVAALETHDDIAVRSQHVNDFSLSFVAPLGADNNGIGHIFTFFRFPGKAGKPVEFGAKLDISVVDGWARLECCSFDAYNEAGNLRAMVERFCAREGHYPSRILADKIYRNRENLSYCKERGIRLSGPALGRPRKDEIQDKAQNYLDECERVEVERRFSLAKRKCGMGLVTAKLQETAAHVIAMSVLVLNLRKIQCALLQVLTALLDTWVLQRKLAFVQ